MKFIILLLLLRTATVCNLMEATRYSLHGYKNKLLINSCCSPVLFVASVHCYSCQRGSWRAGQSNRCRDPTAAISLTGSGSDLQGCWWWQQTWKGEDCSQASITRTDWFDCCWASKTAISLNITSPLSFFIWWSPLSQRSTPWKHAWVLTQFIHWLSSLFHPIPPDKVSNTNA